MSDKPRPDDPHVRLVHALDQLGATMRNLAPALRSYYKALREAGFTPTQALNLTVAFQATLLSMQPPLPPVTDQPD